MSPTATNIDYKVLAFGVETFQRFAHFEKPWRIHKFLLYFRAKPEMIP